MREVLSEYWAKQFFETSGDPAHGKRLFAAKHCAECHSGAGPGPLLPAKGADYNGIAMVSILWRHGPAMLDKMREKHLAWPHFTADEMSSLIAYLNTRGGTVGK